MIWLHLIDIGLKFLYMDFKVGVSFGSLIVVFPIRSATIDKDKETTDKTLPKIKQKYFLYC